MSAIGKGQALNLSVQCTVPVEGIIFIRLGLFLEEFPWSCCLTLVFICFSKLYFSVSKSGFITFASWIIARGIALELPYFSFLQLPKQAAFVSKFSRNKLSAELLNKGNTYLTPLRPSNIYPLPALHNTKSPNNNFSMT